MGIYHYKLPDIGEGVVEAEITAWHVKVGDRVEEDAPIADAMTDKATIELTSPVEGVIRSVACEEGEILAVGAVLVELDVEGPGNAAHNAPAQEAEPEAAPEPAPEPEKPAAVKAAEEPAPKMTPPPAPPSAPPSRRSGDKVLASPAVRARAQNLGLDLSLIGGSGPEGAITHADLDGWLLSQAKSSAVQAPATGSAAKAQSAPPASSKSSAPAAASPQREEAERDAEPGETRVKVIGLRRLISQRMQEAKRHIPHFTYVDDCDVTALEEFRRRANDKKREDQPKLTVLPLFIKALCKTLEDWPQFNARYYDDQGYVSRFDQVHMGMATQTDLGLVVPVIKNAGARTVFDIASEIARLAEAARTNTLSKSDLEGATTTVTSLGPLAGITTTPVINRPEVAIFGPNKIRPVVVMDNGAPAERLMMNISVSCDHRVIDGYDCAVMVQELKARLEDPQRMFLE